MSSVHYHLDGYIAHPGISCNHCQDKLKTYLFNVQTSVEVEAANEEEAYEILNIRGGGEVKDRDTLLVQVIGHVKE